MSPIGDHDLKAFRPQSDVLVSRVRMLVFVSRRHFDLSVSLVCTSV